jgi:hypothetical protein
MPELGFLELAAAGVASWRLAALLVYEGGPWRLILRLRGRLGIEHDDEDLPLHGPAWPDGPRVFKCVWCMSFWTTLAVCLILWVAPYIVMALAVWGIATLLEAFRDRR